MNSYGSGNGGNIILKASESADFSGRSLANPTFVAAATYSEAEDAGNAGKILIDAGDISFSRGASLTSQPMEKAGRGNNHES
ncbi:MAG: hypothetical protein GY749_28115 [Desulfobacteraceae bacterium]|nr:hypothetical protein [Desulfobacteraceae bacterium]